MTDPLSRFLIVAAGLFGAIGVATAAMASHGEEVRNLSAISTMALAHAPVFLIVALAGRGRALTAAAALLALGCIVFVGDLSTRQWLGHALFPGAAPLGGGGLILGWLGIAMSATTFRKV